MLHSLSLLLSIAFFNFTEASCWFDFLKDIFLGIFGGTVVSIVITLIEYLNCKRKNLEQLLDLFYKQRYEFNKVTYFDPEDAKSTNCSDLINAVIKLYQDIKFYHSAIGNIIVDTSFICFPKKKFKNLMSYYGNIQKIDNKFTITNFYFKKIKIENAPSM